MIAGRLRREHDAAVVAVRVQRTTNAWERLRGLLGRPALHSGEGLLIVPCAGVHTLGMGYAIDVVHLARDGRVLKVRPALSPRRLSHCPGAAMTLELAAGATQHHGIAPGQRLVWEEGA